MHTYQLLVLALLFTVPGAAQSSSPRTVSQADVERWMTELSNWGRWGKDDQIGTVHLITSAKRKEAALLVKEGYSVSLARNIETQKAADNPSPFSHTMLSTGAHPDGQFVLDEYR